MALRLVLALGAALTPALAASDDAVPVLNFTDSVLIYDGKADLEEPSGLSTRQDGGFWVVSDDTDRIFAIDAGGEILIRGPRDDLFADLEGIVEDRAHDRLLAVSEADAAVLVIDPATLRFEGATRLRDMEGYDRLRAVAGKRFEGPEGIALGADDAIHVLLERPRVLLEITGDLSTIRAVTPLARDEGFAHPAKGDSALDTSGIVFDPLRRTHWVLSDTGEAVFFRVPATGDVYRFDLSFTEDGRTRSVRNPEGIAISADGSMLSIVTDDGKRSRLLHYAID